MRTPVQSISKRYGILRQIKEREVWSAWVGYEDQPNEGKYRPVLVIDVNDTQTVVMYWNNITDLLMTYMEHHGIGK